MYAARHWLVHDAQLRNVGLDQLLDLLFRSILKMYLVHPRHQLQLDETGDRPHKYPNVVRQSTLPHYP